MTTLAACAAGLERYALPAWVLDPDAIQMLWANAPAVELWGAADRADLLARNFSDISTVMRARVASQAAEAQAGRAVVEQTTFYPRGRPVTVHTHASGIVLDDGRTALLVQVIARDDDGLNPALVRIVEAVRHSTSVFALLDREGAILMKNPAALLAFGDTPWEAWFADRGAAGALLRDAASRGSAEAELFTHTVDGERLHRVKAHEVRDPVTGEPALLVQQTDETARYRAEQALREEEVVVARQKQEILALSTPIVDVGEQALAVLLVGAVDEELAAQVMTRLLAAVVERRANSVILDLTGATRLDETSAPRLMRIARAVRLLGAKMIFSGIRPDAAQMLVQTGAEIDGVSVRRTLRDALERRGGGAR